MTVKKKFNHRINTNLAVDYVVTNKKLTLVAALGVTIGIAIFIFMNSLGSGFVKKSNTVIFSNTPHIRVYKDDEISRPLITSKDSDQLILISNPMVVPKSDRITDPDKILALLKNEQGVTVATPEIALSVFYNSGMSQVPGDASGVAIGPSNKMYNIKGGMVEGRMEDLEKFPNAILLGADIAEKMNVKTGDNISVTSSRNITKLMRVAGLFKTNNSATDKTKSYISIHSAQQFLQQNATYITTINVNIKDFDKAPEYAARFSRLTGYKAEDWKAANSEQLSGFKMRGIIIFAMSLSILLVAGYGTYNILNMTISQRINDIAILKAMGFNGWDVIKIFLVQGFLIGFSGIIVGLLFGAIMVYFTSRIYLGADTGYFPILLDSSVFINGSLFGIIITFLASYLPARKAANVDPVSIFRK